MFVLFPRKSFAKNVCEAVQSLEIKVNATADAMASQSLAGLGGAAIFPDGSSTWFQFRISLADAQSLWPWLGDDMQKHIAAWELLAQFALSYCIATHLPCTRGPIACHQATDNSAADAATAKGLTMTPALAAVLTPYFQFMRRHHMYPNHAHPRPFECAGRRVESLQGTAPCGR